MSKSIIVSSNNQKFYDSVVQELLKSLSIETQSPDYLEIIPEKKQSIGIDQTRKLKLWLQQKPYNSKHKLALIRDADKLTTEAQNSVLKQLEEPPEHSYIVLLCRNHHSMLPTVLSRCELIVDHNQIKQLNNEEFMELSTTGRLKKIEEILKEKDSLISKQVILSLLTSLLIDMEADLREGKITENLLSNIKLVQLTIDMVNSNTSKRLALENLVLNMEEL